MPHLITDCVQQHDLLNNAPTQRSHYLWESTSAIFISYRWCCFYCWQRLLFARLWCRRAYWSMDLYLLTWLFLFITCESCNAFKQAQAMTFAYLYEFLVGGFLHNRHTIFYCGRFTLFAAIQCTLVRGMVVYYRQCAVCYWVMLCGNQRIASKSSGFVFIQRNRSLFCGWLGTFFGHFYSVHTDTFSRTRPRRCFYLRCLRIYYRQCAVLFGRSV